MSLSNAVLYISLEKRAREREGRKKRCAPPKTPKTPTGEIDFPGSSGRPCHHPLHVRGVRDDVRNLGVQSASPRPSLRGHTEQPVEGFRIAPTVGEKSQVDPGFWIRFTVHYNLFAGTVVALGSEEHFDVLETRRTRRLAASASPRNTGVNSGLVVKTTAEYDEKTKKFVFSFEFRKAQEKLDFSKG